LRNPSHARNHALNFLEEKPGVFGLHNGQKVQVDRLTMTIKYEVVAHQSPITFQKYFDVGRSKAITQFAVAKLEAGDHKAEFVFSKNDEGHVVISIVPLGPKSK
jgi:hypothetical protein